MVDFYAPYDERSLNLVCICFYLKSVKKKQIRAQKDFLFQVNFNFLSHFFFLQFRVPWIGLMRFIRYFLGVLGQK
jgi:hypothetical protein